MNFMSIIQRTNQIKTPKNRPRVFLKNFVLLLSYSRNLAEYPTAAVGESWISDRLPEDPWEVAQSQASRHSRENSRECSSIPTMAHAF